jgi:hypothetical protein
MDLIFELIVSLMTMGTVYLVGDKRSFAPIWGCITESTWLCFILYKGLYGLLLMNMCLLILYLRMWYKWKRI